MMKKLTILFALAAMCCMMAFAANGTKIGNIYYILDDTNLTATVTWGGEDANFGTPEYTGSIVIPGSVSYNSNVYQVTSIGEMAFRGCRELTSVTIPESVTSIGAYAFYGDYYLVSANIPLGITRIEDHTFRGCIALASIVIPGGVTYIGDKAFLNCYALADMYVSATTPPIVHTDAFYGMEKDTTFLFVPDVDVYKQADGWKDFTNITTPDFKGTAIAAIDDAIEDVTDAAILAIATQAKTEIGQTETARQAFAIKDKALADINAVKAFLQAKADAIAAINAKIEGVTDTDILAIAEAAKTSISSATTAGDVESIKNTALADLEYPVKYYNSGKTAGDAAGYARGLEEGDAAGYERGKAEGIEEGKEAGYTEGYNAGKAEALGDMGEECTDCTAVEVKKGDKTVKLYNPEKVEFRKE